MARLERLPSSRGMGPLKSLPLSMSHWRRDSRPRLAGICPVNRLALMFNTVSRGRLPSSGGI